MILDCCAPNKTTLWLYVLSLDKIPVFMHSRHLIDNLFQSHLYLLFFFLGVVWKDLPTVFVSFELPQKFVMFHAKHFSNLTDASNRAAVISLCHYVFLPECLTSSNEWNSKSLNHRFDYLLYSLITLSSCLTILFKALFNI